MASSQTTTTSSWSGLLLITVSFSGTSSAIRRECSHELATISTFQLFGGLIPTRIRSWNKPCATRRFSWVRESLTTRIGWNISRQSILRLDDKLFHSEGSADHPDVPRHYDGGLCRDALCSGRSG